MSLCEGPGLSMIVFSLSEECSFPPDIGHTLNNGLCFCKIIIYLLKVDVPSLQRLKVNGVLLIGFVL